MRGQQTYKSTFLVFRQWSRKNYAIFASLSKEISIGHVDIDICDKSIEKSSKIGLSVREKTLLPDETEETDEYLNDPAKQLQVSYDFCTLDLIDPSRRSYFQLKNQTTQIQNKFTLKPGFNCQLFKIKDYDSKII